MPDCTYELLAKADATIECLLVVDSTYTYQWHHAFHLVSCLQG